MSADKNIELMKLAGSKTGAYDPESPDHWRYVLENGAPEERALAWVKSKTIHMSRSPFCVNSSGKALYVESLAADLGWTAHTASNVLTALVKQGRVRLDSNNKRIWYRADVPKTGGSNGENKSSVQRIYPSYVVEFLESLPEPDRKAKEAEAEAVFGWTDNGFAEVAAAWRRIVEPIEDSMFRSWGIDKKRLPKRRKIKLGGVQLQLKQVPEFVQRIAPQMAADLVQTGKPASYEVENGVYKTPAAAASLLSSDTDTDLSGSVGRSSVESAAETDRPTGSATEVKAKSPRTEKPSLKLVDSGAIEAALVEEMGERLPHAMPGRSMCARIVPLLRGAPLDNLRTACGSRWKKFTSYGLAEEIAREVGNAWVAGGARRAGADARAALLEHLKLPTRATDAELEDALAVCKEILGDPAASQEDRAFALHALGARAKTAGGGS